MYYGAVTYEFGCLITDKHVMLEKFGVQKHNGDEKLY